VAAQDSSSHYFDADPEELARLGSAPREVTWTTHRVTLTAESDRGVFSHGSLDRGTEVLLSHVPSPPASGVFLDLGCGWGAIALTLGSLSPAAEVWALDVNPRARELTATNSSRLGLANVRVVAPDRIPTDLTFDLIWSNPPIRIGKEALHDLLRQWLSRLSPSGEAYLVVQKHLGSDSLAAWLADQGWDVDRIGSKKGFRILRVRPQ